MSSLRELAYPFAVTVEKGDVATVPVRTCTTPMHDVIFKHLQFYFCHSRTIRETAKVCTMQKFPDIWYTIDN